MYMTSNPCTTFLLLKNQKFLLASTSIASYSAVNNKPAFNKLVDKWKSLTLVILAHVSILLDSVAPL